MISKNGVALLLLIVSALGLEASETDIQALIASVANVVSFGFMVYNQLARKDTKWFLWKTDNQD